MLGLFFSFKDYYEFVFCLNQDGLAPVFTLHWLTLSQLSAEWLPLVNKILEQQVCGISVLTQ